MTKGYCDNCMEFKEVRRISLGGGAGGFFCDSCLREEIEWRKEMNKTLHKSAQFRTKYKFKMNNLNKILGG